MRLQSLCVLMICAAAVWWRPVAAEELSAPRLAGMGQSGASSAEGLDALGTNPALIGRGIRNVGFTIYPAGGFVLPLFGLGHPSSAKFSYDDLDLLLNRFNSNYNSSQKYYIADVIDLGRMNFSIEGTIAACVIPLGAEHTIGMHIMQHASGKYSLAPGIDQIIHDKAVSGNAVPLLLRSPVSAEAQWYNEYSVSYAYAPLGDIHTPLADAALPEFGVGITLKYIQGLGHATVVGGRLSTISLGSNPVTGTTIQTAIDFDIVTANAGAFDAKTIPVDPLFTLFPKAVGSGAGADIGLMKSIPMSGSVLTAALSITDIGAITWSESPSMRSVHRVDTIQMGGLFYAVDSLKQYEGVSRPASAFTTSLPTRLHLAVSIENFHSQSFFPRLISAEYTQGLADVVGTSTSPRFAVGGEWRRNIWRWSTGLAFNTDEHVSWGVGGGVSIFTHALFEVALGRLNGLWEFPQLVNAVARLSVLY